MIDLYYWTTPNGHKITIFLEEARLPYNLIAVDIGKGEQFAPEFLRIAPNNRIPAIVDHAPTDAGAPVTLFESGAILLYLAEKSGQFLATDLRGRQHTLQWLFWQVAGLGPMAGQNHHFTQYAPVPIEYAIQRYVNETARLYAVLDKQLSDGREYIDGDYSIADMACYPWIVSHERQRQDLAQFPHLAAWFQRIGTRPGVQRAYARAAEFSVATSLSEEARRVLFGQSAGTVR